MKRSLLFLMCGIMATLPALGQDQPSGVAAKWIPAGTYALSNFNNNTEREKTYWGASREKGRIASYLPGMTIFYQPKKGSEPERKAYLIGLTQSGLPVAVLESDISVGDFSQRPTRDVVIHREHSACKASSCDEDMIPVGGGYSFSIVSEDDNEITLGNTDELRVFYSKAEFDDYEVKGILTRHKDRKYPRWDINEGYAKKLSAGCGEVIAKHTRITVPAALYESNPSGWGLNDDAWSLRAIEAFNLGTVQKQSNSYEGVIDGDIDGTDLAVDITVFAYRDTQEWSPGFYKYGGIVSKVVCAKPGIGNRAPSYVKDAIVFFDQDPREITMVRLPQYNLASQISEPARASISEVVGRSLFYSINSPGQYEKVFSQLSEKIKNPHAVSVIIARLNASCRKQDRKQCRAKISKTDPD